MRMRVTKWVNIFKPLVNNVAFIKLYKQVFIVMRSGVSYQQSE